MKPLKLTKTHTNGFSILIPSKGPCNKLNKLLQTIQSQDYPHTKFEVIIIDDQLTIKPNPKHFTYKLTLLKHQNPNALSPKKVAIEQGVNNSKYPWVITTDSDCLVPKKWLSELNSLLNQKKDKAFFILPVNYKIKKGFLSHFQYYDWLSLQGITFGSALINKPFICSGANLLYKKSLFMTLKGFEGNQQYASGDDVFLLQKASSYNKKLISYGFSKNLMVETLPVKSFNSLINQRIRWAKKSKAYKGTFAQFCSLAGLLTNLTWVLILVYSFFKTKPLVISLLLLKILLDTLFLLKINQQYNKVSKYLIQSVFFYPLFIFLLSLRFIINPNFLWKGKTYRR